MKASYIVLLLTWVTTVNAQNNSTGIDKPPCNCSALLYTSGRKDVVSETEAQKIVYKYVNNFPLAKSKSNEFVVIEALCTNPGLADICQDPNNHKDKYCIFFNNYQLQKQGSFAHATWWDRFVLGHELGHHVLGHTDKEKYKNRMPEEWPTMGNDEETNRRARELVQNIGKQKFTSNQVQELQADIIGLWLLWKIYPDFQLRFLDENFGKAIELERVVLNRELKSQNKKVKNSFVSVSNADHPSFVARQSQLRKFWSVIAQNDGYKAKAFESFSEQFYADFLKEHAYWNVEAVGRLGAYAATSFYSINGNPMAALLTKDQSIGMRISLNKMDARLRWLDIDIAYNKQQYSTYRTENDHKKTVESLDYTFLMIQPKLTYTLLSNRKDSTHASRWKLTTSFGGSVNLPIGYQYQNYATGLQLNQTALTVNPFFMLSIERNRRWFNNVSYDLLAPGNYRLSLRYTPQLLTVRPDPQLQVWSHTISVELAFSIYRLPIFRAHD